MTQKGQQKPLKTWLVVSFLDTDGGVIMNVIPSKWLRYTDGSCFALWPPIGTSSGDVEQMIQACCVPNEDTWSHNLILDKTPGEFASYLKAREYEKVIIMVQDVAKGYLQKKAADELNKRVKYRRRTALPGESSSTDDGSKIGFADAPAKKKARMDLPKPPELNSNSSRKSQPMKSKFVNTLPIPTPSVVTRTTSLPKPPLPAPPQKSARKNNDLPRPQSVDPDGPQDDQERTAEVSVPLPPELPDKSKEVTPQPSGEPEINTDQSEISTQKNAQSKFLAAFYEFLVTYKTDTTEIKHKLQAIISNSNGGNSTYEPTIKLPATTVKELENIDALIGEDPRYKNYMIQEFKGYTGSDIRCFVQSNLRKILLNKVALTYSFKGAKKKAPFCNLTNIITCMKDAARFIPNRYDDKLFAEAACDWLSQASRRKDPPGYEEEIAPTEANDEGSEECLDDEENFSSSENENDT